MARFSLENMHVIPMPELKGPDWIVGTTPPVHRVRYWLWSRLFGILDHASDRMKGIAFTVQERADACGPQPIIDESKLPTSVSFAWSSVDPTPHRTFHVERDA